jgi:hypothetical protein
MASLYAGLSGRPARREIRTRLLFLISHSGKCDFYVVILKKFGEAVELFAEHFHFMSACRAIVEAAEAQEAFAPVNLAQGYIDCVYRALSHAFAAGNASAPVQLMADDHLGWRHHGAAAEDAARSGFKADAAFAVLLQGFRSESMHAFICFYIRPIPEFQDSAGIS